MEELVCRYCGKVLQSIEEGGVQGLRLFTSPFQSCSPDSLCETLRSKANGPGGLVPQRMKIADFFPVKIGVHWGEMATFAM